MSLSSHAQTDAAYTHIHTSNPLHTGQCYSGVEGSVCSRRHKIGSNLPTEFHINYSNELHLHKHTHIHKYKYKCNYIHKHTYIHACLFYFISQSKALIIFACVCGCSTANIFTCEKINIFA